MGDTTVELDFRIADRESVTVPAGTFNAFRVEAQGWQTGIIRGTQANNRWNWKTWYAPDQVRMPVLQEQINRGMGGKMGRGERFELVAFKQS